MPGLNSTVSSSTAGTELIFSSRAVTCCCMASVVTDLIMASNVALEYGMSSSLAGSDACAVTPTVDGALTFPPSGAS